MQTRKAVLPVIPRTPEITLASFSPVCLAWLREQQMWDANKCSCRKLTGVRLFLSKKITFLGLGFMILHSWSKQYSAIKEGKTQWVWNIIFIPRSEGWSWPKEKRLNLPWRWEESVQVTQASASPALWQCVHVLWREKLQTLWEPTLCMVVPSRTPLSLSSSAAEPRHVLSLRNCTTSIPLINLSLHLVS